MLIRTAQPTDLGAVHRLLHQADLPEEGVEDQFGPGYALAVEGDGVLGAAGIERYGRSGLLRSVVTSPEARGRGIARALVENRLAWAATEGIETVYLLTTTAADYFPRLGFDRVDRSEVPQEVRESKEFGAVCPSSAIAMRRRTT